ncbi:MAG: amidase [Acidobacteriota bacterium]
MSKKNEDRDLPGISRRRFLQVTTTGAATLSLLSGCRPGEPSSAENEKAGATSLTDFELDEMSVSELKEAMERGRYSCRSIVERYLSRVDSLNRQGPALRALIETNPDALEIAESLDQERRSGNLRGPLHGIPVVLKDNIDTADKMTTTAGSLALQGSIAPRDSFVAQRLREAGALILGKANLSEWANFRSDHSSSGWSGRGGQCRNPYDITRNPCGSSSGSAVAVSANLTALAVGTETNGSIVCPSNACGIVGIKPTVGLVGRSGIVPISHTQDTAGPMARSVGDAALMLGAMTGPDPRDEATKASRGNAHRDYTSFLDESALKGTRLGVVRQAFGFSPKVERVLEGALEELKRRGAELVEVDLPRRREYGDSSFQLLLYEFKADLNAYLTSLGPSAPVKSLAEIIAFNQQHKDEEMPYFGQELFIQAEKKGPLTEKAYQEARERSLRVARQGIDKAMDEQRLNALIAPTGGPAWKIDLVTGDHFSGSSSSPAARAGYPNITVPAGSVQGLPVGLSFFGRAWSEPTLIGIAYAFEQATQARKKPRFLEGVV